MVKYESVRMSAAEIAVVDTLGKGKLLVLDFRLARL